MTPSVAGSDVLPIAVERCTRPSRRENPIASRH